MNSSRADVVAGHPCLTISDVRVADFARGLHPVVPVLHGHVQPIASSLQPHEEHCAACRPLQRQFRDGQAPLLTVLQQLHGLPGP